MFEKYVKADFRSYEDFKQNFKINVPEHFNFAYDVLDELAVQKPDKKALVWVSENGDQKIFTFADLKVLSDKAANYFRSLGIKKGDKVMLILKRHYEFWYTIMALHKIGAVIIPATHLLTKKDIEYRVCAAGIRMIVCTNEGSVAEQVDLAENMPTLKFKAMLGDKDGWLNFKRGTEQASDVFEKPDELPENDDIMLLYFTSGTTGLPKMVILSYTYPLGHIPTAVFWQNVDPDGMHLTISDTGWAKSVWGKLYGQWLGETAVFVYDHEKFIPHKMLQAICDNRVTTFCAPPTMYRYFIKEDLSKYDFSALKYATIAGEPLNPEVFFQFKNATGLKMMEGFGQTETTISVANFIYMEPKPGSMGKPSPLFDVDIIDDEGRPCEWGKTGEVVIHTGSDIPPGMFLGYYQDEALTGSVWHDGLYHTGDVAWKDEDGYYWYVGRTDDVIKSSGYRIGPFEVESALMEHPAVLETAITGVPHPDRGQVVKATIVLAKGYEPTEALKRQLQEHVKKVTAPYKYPREIEFVTELPKTISGKIRRVELREKDEKK
ncbi:MAG: AMP-binding protein [Eubacteriales bacterium]|nr:AMP-binding protein [Eubacteriales bacterium]